MTRSGLAIVPEAAYEDEPALDLLWVPGGGLDGLRAAMNSRRLRQRLRAWAADAAYVTSVCEGALVLASAGLLDGFRATTHWAFLPCLRAYPRITVVGEEARFPRFVVDDGGGARVCGTRVTGAGISSGLDEALELVRMLCGVNVARGVQRTIQYYPRPPIRSRLVPATICPLQPGHS